MTLAIPATRSRTRGLHHLAKAGHHHLRIPRPTRVHLHPGAVANTMKTNPQLFGHGTLGRLGPIEWILEALPRNAFYSNPKRCVWGHLPIPMGKNPGSPRVSASTIRRRRNSLTHLSASPNIATPGDRPTASPPKADGAVSVAEKT